MSIYITKQPQYRVEVFSGLSSIDSILALAGENKFTCTCDESGRMELEVGGVTLKNRSQDCMVKSPIGEIFVMTLTEVKQQFEPLQEAK